MEIFVDLAESFSQYNEESSKLLKNKHLQEEDIFLMNLFVL